MEKQNTNPHDDFFKVAFSRKDVVEDYITQFLKGGLAKNIDLQSLTISNNSYVTPELAEYFADVVWECNYGTSKTPIKITFLFEHKSYIPKYPHIQLLRYMLEIWEDCEKNKLPLMPVIPIIVYHNADEKRHWKYKPFSAYFKEVDDFLRPFIPSFEYELTDLTNLSEQEWQTLKTGLLLHSFRTLQFGTNKQFVLQNIEMLFVSVKNNEKDGALETFLLSQLVYILRNNEFSPENAKKIIQTVKKISNMSSYDYLMQEAKNIGLELGRQEGREEGIELGIDKGVSIKEKDFATSLIASTDFDDAKIAMLVGVTVEYVSDLRAELGK